MTITDRKNASALMKPEQVTAIQKMVGERSVVLSRMRRLPNMTSKQTRMPVLDALPVTYFVDGDTGRKQTTHAEWKDKYITAEELAVIVPLPESVIDDAGFNITAEIIPLIADAFAKKIDDAILNGASRPASWPEGLLTLARNNGHIVSMGSGNTDLYAKIMGVDGLFHSVEKDGYDVNGMLGSIKAKAYVRGLVDTTGRPLTLGGADVNGINVGYVNNGSWSDGKALLLAGDFTKAVYAMRQDITMKKFTEGVIQDGDGAIAYNLMQNDMIALRFVMRLGWQVANPVTQANGNAETRYPLSLLTENSPSALTEVTFTVSSDAGTTKVKDAIVSYGGMERKTNTSGVAKFNVPADSKGPWMVKKGDVVKYGSIAKASTGATVAVNNFA